MELPGTSDLALDMNEHGIGTPYGDTEEPNAENTTEASQLYPAPIQSQPIPLDADLTDRSSTTSLNQLFPELAMQTLLQPVDESGEPMPQVPVPAPAIAVSGSVPEFLYQLTKMLTDDNSDVIEWSNGACRRDA